MRHEREAVRVIGKLQALSTFSICLDICLRPARTLSPMCKNVRARACMDLRLLLVPPDIVQRDVETKATSTRITTAQL